MKINEALNRQPIRRMGQPVRSWQSRGAELIQNPGAEIGYATGGNVLAGLSNALKSGLGFYGAMQDARNQKAYNENLAQLAEQNEQAEQAQEYEARRLGYIKAGINPDRLNEKGYLDEVLDRNAVGGPKGEFGYIMAEINDPNFQTKYTPEQQKLMMDRANSMAKGLDYTYGSAYSTALGKGQGELRTAQDIAREKAIGSELLQRGEGGELTPIKGTKEDAARTEKKEKYLQGMRSSLEKSDMMLDFIDKAINLVQSNPLTAGAGALLSFNPYSDAGKLRSYLATIKGNVGLNELISSKAEGATYGALSENELQMLQDSLGRLEQGQSPEVLLQVLNNVRNNYMNVRNRAYNALQGGQQPQQKHPSSNAEELWNSIGGN